MRDRVRGEIPIHTMSILHIVSTELLTLTMARLTHIVLYVIG